MNRSFPEIAAEHDFRTATKNATRGVMERISEGELQPVLDALKSHPFPQHINFEEIVLQTISDNFPVIFDGVMDYVSSHCSPARYTKCLRKAVAAACEHDFLHALEYDRQWTTTVVGGDLKFRDHLLSVAAYNSSAACMQFVMPLNDPLKTKQWIDLLGECIQCECVATLDLLFTTAPAQVTYQDKLNYLMYLIPHAEQSEELYAVVFAHFLERDIMACTPVYRHNAVATMYEEYQAQRAREEAQRIEDQLTMPIISRERKL